MARRLAAAPEVSFVAITTGGYDVLVAALFRSNEELLQFATARLSKLRGVTRTSTSTVLKLVKRTLAVPLPATVPSPRPGRPRRRRRRRRR